MLNIINFKKEKYDSAVVEYLQKNLPARDQVITTPFINELCKQFEAAGIELTAENLEIIRPVISKLVSDTYAHCKRIADNKPKYKIEVNL